MVGWLGSQSFRQCGQLTSNLPQLAITNTACLGRLLRPNQQIRSTEGLGLEIRVTSCCLVLGMCIHVDCIISGLQQYVHYRSHVKVRTEKSSVEPRKTHRICVYSYFFLNFEKILTGKPHVSSWIHQDGRISFRTDLRSQSVMGIDPNKGP